MPAERKSRYRLRSEGLCERFGAVGHRSSRRTATGPRRVATPNVVVAPRTLATPATRSRLPWVTLPQRSSPVSGCTSLATISPQATASKRVPDQRAGIRPRRHRGRLPPTRSTGRRRALYTTRPRRSGSRSTTPHLARTAQHERPAHAPLTVSANGRASIPLERQS
jgi:hypothetical protein